MNDEERRRMEADGCRPPKAAVDDDRRRRELFEQSKREQEERLRAFLLPQSVEMSQLKKLAEKAFVEAEAEVNAEIRKEVEMAQLKKLAGIQSDGITVVVTRDRLTGKVELKTHGAPPDNMGRGAVLDILKFAQKMVLERIGTDVLEEPMTVERDGPGPNGVEYEEEPEPLRVVSDPTDRKL